jgi:hypothetical protein
MDDEEEEEGEFKDHRDTKATGADSTLMSLEDTNATVSNHEIYDDVEEWHFDYPKPTTDASTSMNFRGNNPMDSNHEMYDEVEEWHFY